MILGRFARLATLLDETLEASGRQAEREPAYQVQVLVDSYLALDESEEREGRPPVLGNAGPAHGVDAGSVMQSPLPRHFPRLKYTLDASSQVRPPTFPPPPLQAGAGSTDTSTRTVRLVGFDR